MRQRQAIIAFACHASQIAEKIRDYAGGYEIKAASHAFAGNAMVSVVLVVVGPVAEIMEHERNVREWLPSPPISVP